MALVVVAYDISHDRRRAKMHRLLLGFGKPVQESVFECDLDEPGLRELRARLRRLVRLGDSVRLYPLCADCATRIDDGLGRRPAPAPDVYVT